ncbi:MAG: pyrophosphohydrolase including oxidative damage repair enzyme [Clostridia bacterium]|jgi:ADP-ribose pyrophosphatase|nr:pyrophosphohydrolase including oxidative damage repair enzyme [Clostridia bacterium]
MRLINREIVYKGKIFDVAEDTIEIEKGKVTKWDLVLHNGATAIVPITENNEIILVRQYRNAENGELLEIPAGKLEKGEDPYDCAMRELEEETGYRAGHMEKVCAMFSAVGFSDEKLHLYIATQLRLGQQDLDEDEYITLEKYPLSQAVNMIFEGTIQDSKTIVGIFAAQHFLNK